MVSTTVKRTLSLSVVIGTMQTRRQEGASESIILVHPIDADDEKIVVVHVPMLARWDSPRRSSHREHLLSPHHVIAPRTTPHHEFSGLLCVFILVYRTPKKYLGNTILVKLELSESVMVIISFGLPLTYAYSTLRQSVAGNSTFRGIVFCNLGTAKTDIKIRHQGKYCYPIYFPI
jgi:hypothetical protein